MPLVGLGLLKLTPQGVVRDAKLPGYLSNAPVWRGPDKTDGFSLEFWRVAWCCSRHRVDSLRRHSYPKLWFVRRLGSRPDQKARKVQGVRRSSSPPPVSAQSSPSWAM